MARKPDMIIDQLVNKLEHANSVHVKSINASTPLLLGLYAGESLAKKLSPQIGGGTARFLNSVLQYVTYSIDIIVPL